MGYHEHNSAGKVIGAGIFGLILGAVAAMLFAPRSGKENRMRLRNWMRDMSDELNSRLEEARDMSRDKYNNMVDQLSDRYRKVQDIKDNELDDFTDELKRRWERIKRRWQEE